MSRPLYCCAVCAVRPEPARQDAPKGRSEHCQDAQAKRFAEVAVDEWVDATVGRPEPLRDRNDVPHDQHLFVALETLSEQDPQPNGVERQPGDGEDDGYCDQHPNDADLGRLDVAFRLGSSDARDAATADLHGNHRVEDSDETERQKIAGEEDDSEEVSLDELLLLVVDVQVAVSQRSTVTMHVTQFVEDDPWDLGAADRQRPD